MNPTNKVHLPFLDGIRGIAALSVFLFHALGPSFGFLWLEWKGLFRDFNVPSSFIALYPLTYGLYGVAVFFVVSGFCIHLSHQRNKENGWGSFVNRRFFRIYPPYLLAVIVFFFISPWGSLSIDSFRRIVQLFTHLIAIHNFDERTIFSINPSFWSIAVELQLYALYPLLIAFSSKLGWKRSLIIVGSIEMCGRLYESYHNFTYNEPLPRYIVASPLIFWFSWSLGAYLCECFLSKKSSRLFNIRFDFLCMVAFPLPFFNITDPFTFPAFSLLTAIAIERLVTNKWTLPKNRCFQWTWSHLSFLGTISYSFYLFHQPIIFVNSIIFEKLLPGTTIHPLTKYAACLAWYPIILVLSYFVFHYVERPSIQLGKLFWSKMKRTKPA